jgi:hypothetical protein
MRLFKARASDRRTGDEGGCWLPVAARNLQLPTFPSPLTSPACRNREHPPLLYTPSSLASRRAGGILPLGLHEDSPGDAVETRRGLKR